MEEVNEVREEVNEEIQLDQAQDNDSAEAAATEATADVEALIAEAEQRGYMRGRKERIEELMGEPGLLEPESRGAACGEEPDGVEILRNRRVSIWDL